MSEKFKYGVLVEKGKAEVHEEVLREVGDDEVLVKQDACNICTTDYTQWLGLREHQGYPMAGGHEGNGIVIKKGKNVKEFELGDRVAAIYDHCGKCEYCKKGEINLCTETKKLMAFKGGTAFFGFADYAVRNTVELVKLRQDINPSAGGFVEPLATVVCAQKKLKHQLGDIVVVIGAGTMGILNAMVARLYGSKVYISELLDKKIEKARELGFEVIDAKETDPVEFVKEVTNGKKADTIIMAVGATGANAQALEMIKDRDGQILYFSAGYPKPELNIDSNDLHYRRLDLIGAYAAEMEDFYMSAKLLNTGLIDTEPLVEAKYLQKDIQAAFEHASKEGMYRVSLIMNEELM
ncbi:zinc-dependent alcohol dehydrogenase [Enterococcus avium]|uniref:zinc-dependent alcohol dehydrogenase n=1 Tax=Enterococcus avium TaxID=33945 RepID=UPI0032E50E95